MVDNNSTPALGVTMTVSDRWVQILLLIMQQYLRPGTIVQWATYRNVQQLNTVAEYSTVNGSLNFVYPVTSIHTQKSSPIRTGSSPSAMAAILTGLPIRLPAAQWLITLHRLFYKLWQNQGSANNDKHAGVSWGLLHIDVAFSNGSKLSPKARKECCS